MIIFYFFLAINAYERTFATCGNAHIAKSIWPKRYKTQHFHLIDLTSGGIDRFWSLNYAIAQQKHQFLQATTQWNGTIEPHTTNHLMRLATAQKQGNEQTF